MRSGILWDTLIAASRNVWIDSWISVDMLVNPDDYEDDELIRFAALGLCDADLDKALGSACDKTFPFTDGETESETAYLMDPPEQKIDLMRWA